MNGMPKDKELIDSAKRIAWRPDEVQDILNDQNYYLRMVMQNGTDNEIRIAKKHFTKEEFIEALEVAPLGFFMGFVWHDWREKLGLPPKKAPSRYPGEVSFPECYQSH